MQEAHYANLNTRKSAWKNWEGMYFNILHESFAEFVIDAIQLF